MMKNKHTRQPDLETLSAYLDHELNEAEEQALLSRLSRESALQRQLDDLRQTRYVLRRTPKVRRPRSFVLTPEMVKQQRFAAGAWNISRWVSAVASVLLIVMIGGQYLLGGGAMLGAESQNDLAISADEAIEEPMMAMEAPEEESAADIAPFIDETEMADADASDTQDDMPADEEPAAAEMAPMETPTAEGTSEPGGGGGLPPSAQEPTPTVEILGLGGGPTMTLSPEEQARMVPADKLPEDTGDGQGVTALDQLPEEEIVPPQPGLELSPWRLAQAGMLALALIAAIAAAFFRKQVR